MINLYLGSERDAEIGSLTDGKQPLDGYVYEALSMIPVPLYKCELNTLVTFLRTRPTVPGRVPWVIVAETPGALTYFVHI